MKYVIFLIFCIVIHFVNVDSFIYLEDVCTVNPHPALTWSTSGHLKATRASSYFLGRNCSFAFSSPYEVIISVKQISFRPGCYDYLKIADGNKRVALCGTKNELDSNMQFYGKNIYMNYFIEDGGPDPNGFTGFHLTYTLSERSVTCDKNFRFQCHNGYCISNRFICDGNNNCGDFTDEKGCGRSGVVMFVAMFIISIMGIVGGFCISLGLVAVISLIVSKRNRAGSTALLPSTTERRVSDRF